MILPAILLLAIHIHRRDAEKSRPLRGGVESTAAVFRPVKLVCRDPAFVIADSLADNGAEVFVESVAGAVVLVEEFLEVLTGGSGEHGSPHGGSAYRWRRCVPAILSFLHSITNSPGLHGLIMAKTYLEVHPTASLLIVDESHSVGGTWAKERIYPGLRTNNVWGSYELSDFHMRMKGCVQSRPIHISGEVVQTYLYNVAEHIGLTPHLLLKTRVIATKLVDDGSWEVSIEPVTKPKRHAEIVRAAKLVFATGLTSKPLIPEISGSETFGGLMLHSKQLKKQAHALAGSKRVAVVGGNKSAWDVCYTAARAGSQVDMIIRPSGGGPSYVWPKTFSIGLLDISLAWLSMTRLFVLFDPAPFNNSGPFSGLKRLLHRTTIGQLICRFFWGFLDWLIRRLNGYNTHPELKKLEPWTTPFWMGNSLSILNYPTSWFDLVRQGKIHVHIADVTGLSKRRVHLSNGDILDVDALVLCTGWTTDIPVQLEDIIYKKEGSEAVETIYKSVPYLQRLPRRTSNAPALQEPSASERKSPSFPLLYRDIIPPQQSSLEQKNLAFIGMSVSIHAILVAQAQALWITAMFSDKIPHLQADNLDPTQLQRRAILDRAYGKVRRPRETGGLAGRHADLVFDSLPYVDELLRDLGMPVLRKGSWWRELTEAYGPRDYSGLVQEWMRLQKMEKMVPFLTRASHRARLP
ncbi:hypothetical protein BDV12DRAFT_206354 [Aspergillus spectabilis]